MAPKKSNPLLFAISGPLEHVGRQLYSTLKTGYEDGTTFQGKRVAFIGTTFPNAPFPLLAGDKHKKRPPDAEIVRSWSRLLEFARITIIPALSEYDVVICRRLGLDAVLFATACEQWDDLGECAMEIHHDLVQMVLLRHLGLQPPIYLIPHADNGRMKKLLIEGFPNLAELGDQVIDPYLVRQTGAMSRYFGPTTGQKEPKYLDACGTSDAMIDDAVAFIDRHLALQG